MDNATENLLMQQMGQLMAKTENIEKAVLGNGQPGLLQRVQDLEESRKYVWGVGTAITALGGFVEWLIHRH